MTTTARRLSMTLPLAGLIALAPAVAWADDAVTTLTFAEGSPTATASGTVSGAARADHLVEASTGDRLAVTLSAPSASVNFDVIGPDAVDPLHVGALDGVAYDAVLETAGTHVVRVYLDGAAAAEGRSVPFDLTVTLTAEAPPAEEVAEDAVESAADVPAFLEVANLTTRLNLRAEPSTAAAVLRTAPLGTQLRNHGCEELADRRWCEIETADGLRGWAAGEYLRDSDGAGF